MLKKMIIRNSKIEGDEFVLDFTATSDSSLPHHVVITKSGERILKLLGVSGNNNAGKTMFFKAFNFVKNCLLNSLTIEDGDFHKVQGPQFEQIPIPFVEFEISVDIAGVPYQYYLNLREGLVVSESLKYSPKGRISLLFERQDSNQYRLNAQQQFWVEATHSCRPNQSFLAVIAQQENAEIQSIYKFLTEGFQLYRPYETFNYETFVKIVQDEAKFKMFNSLVRATMDDVVRTEISETGVIQLIRKTIEGSDFVLLASEDSSGVQELIKILSHVVVNIDRPTVLFMDDFDSSLHTLLAQYLLRIFQDSQLNKGNLQFVLSFRRWELLSQKSFRRDQLVCVYKDEIGNSRLISLRQAGVRKDQKVLNYYLDKFGYDSFSRSASEVTELVFKKIE